MHPFEAEASLNHSRSRPVRDSEDDNLTSPPRVTPRSQLHTSVDLSSVLSDAIESSPAVVNTAHCNATSTSIHVQPSSYGWTPARTKSESDSANTNRCTNCGDNSTNAYLDIPSTPRRRRDSFLRSPGSSDGGRDHDSFHGKLTPASSESGTDYQKEEAVALSNFHDWTLSSPWRIDRELGPIVSSPSIEEWTTAGADDAEDSDEPEYDEVKSIYDHLSTEESILRTGNAAIRPYTSSLGVPGRCQHGSSLELDVISDAGDQQQLEQRHTKTSSEIEHAKANLEQSLASLRANESCHELQESILEALQRNHNHSHDQEFLPRGELCRLIYPKSVARELTKDLVSIHTSEQIDRYAEAVCSETRVLHRGKAKIKTFRKIFALLVIVEATSSISLFLEEDVSDLDLPLIPIKYQGSNGLCLKDTSGKPSTTPLNCFKHPKWSPIKRRNFQEYQWKMLAPFFSRDDCGDVKHYTLEDQHIMPFVAPEHGQDENADRTGGFGKVLMVRIHKDHHNFRDQRLCDRGFAIKQQLYECDREAFKKEISILKRFSGERSHRHIVSLLATYEQFRKFHLVFYRAEGDLFAYWREIETHPVFNHRNVTWMTEQCAGIAEALLKLHRHLTSNKHPVIHEDDHAHHDTESTAKVKPKNARHVRIIEPARRRVQSSDSLEQPASPIVADHSFPRSLPSTDDGEEPLAKKYGRHGDINPGNILWYDDTHAEVGTLKGTLKLADFGQAELNSLLSRTKPRSVANTMTYRPPECDLQPKIIRQSYDIWCLGCVYLEFVAWILGGEPLLLRFTLKRMTVDVFQNNQLTDTFFQIVRDPETHKPKVMIKQAVTHFIDELHRHTNCTDFLHEFLNIIQNNMLVIESADRASCEEIWRVLNDMHKKCRTNKVYATWQSPWCIEREPMPRSVGLEMSADAERIIEQNLPAHALQV